ncbi:MAG: LuxR C-terminal-related transcriptional regulator [Ilumatobacter sp.]
MHSIDVGVFDDNVIFASGVVAVLRDDPRVNGVSLDPDDAGRVDVAVMSAHQITSAAVTCPIVACTSPREPALVEPETMGVVAILERDELTPDQLCSAIHAAAAGLRIHWDAKPGAGLLDDRSREVLRLLASGAGTREISSQLGYSERTIKGTISEVQRALGARSRAHAVAVALRSALI